MIIISMLLFVNIIKLQVHRKIKGINMIKRFSFLLLVIPMIASAQLRVGLDAGRVPTLKAGDKEVPWATEPDGMAISFGYEKYLIGIVGVGAEYTLDLAEENTFNTAFVYGAARIPFPFPFIKGVVRAGYSMPGGDASDKFDAGTAFGFGLRAKFPFIPLGLEAQFMRHALVPNDKYDEFAKLAGDLEFFMNSINLAATLKF